MICSMLVFVRVVLDIHCCLFAAKCVCTSVRPGGLWLFSVLVVHICFYLCDCFSFVWFASFLSCLGTFAMPVGHVVDGNCIRHEFCAAWLSWVLWVGRGGFRLPHLPAACSGRRGWYRFVLLIIHLTPLYARDLARGLSFGCV